MPKKQNQKRISTNLKVTENNATRANLIAMITPLNPTDLVTILNRSNPQAIKSILYLIKKQFVRVAEVINNKKLNPDVLNSMGMVADLDTLATMLNFAEESTLETIMKIIKDEQIAEVINSEKLNPGVLNSMVMVADLDTLVTMLNFAGESVLRIIMSAMSFDQFAAIARCGDTDPLQLVAMIDLANQEQLEVMLHNLNNQCFVNILASENFANVFQRMGEQKLVTFADHTNAQMLAQITNANCQRRLELMDRKLLIYQSIKHLYFCMIKSACDFYNDELQLVFQARCRIINQRVTTSIAQFNNIDLDIEQLEILANNTQDVLLNWVSSVENIMADLRGVRPSEVYLACEQADAFEQACKSTNKEAEYQLRNIEPMLAFIENAHIMSREQLTIEYNRVAQDDESIQYMNQIDLQEFTDAPTNQTNPFQGEQDSSDSQSVHEM